MENKKLIYGSHFFHVNLDKKYIYILVNTYFLKKKWVEGEKVKMNMWNKKKKVILEETTDAIWKDNILASL